MPTIWEIREKLINKNAKKMNISLDGCMWRAFPACLDCQGFDKCPVPVEEKATKFPCEGELYDKYHKEWSIKRNVWLEDRVVFNVVKEEKSNA